MTEPLLTVTDLVKHFPISRSESVHAVDGVSFHIGCHETLGLVGESGCGKTTTGRALLRLIEPDSGSVVINGIDLLSLDSVSLLKMRKRAQIIFQDPYSSLDPRKNVRQLVSEPLLIHRAGSRREVNERVDFLLDMVGLGSREGRRYPHELDGGRCQRVGIARALALGPEFLVCDEPVSALDVSIQAQILNLLQDLQEDLGLSYLFVSHDLSVVRHVSSRVMVMYLGKVVEEAQTQDLYHNPLHPYSQALLSAIPVPSLGAKRERLILKGDVPTPVNPKPGCRFAPRCWKVLPRCLEETPELSAIRDGHKVACYQALGNGKGGET